jgi:hypothetical protein
MLRFSACRVARKSRKKQKFCAENHCFYPAAWRNYSKWDAWRLLAEVAANSWSRIVIFAVTIK